MSLISKIDDTIYSYATLRQQEVIDAVNKADGNQTKAAETLGITHQTINGALNAAINRASKRGYSPDHDMKHSVPDGFVLKGTSTIHIKNRIKTLENMDIVGMRPNKMFDNLY